MGDLFSGISTAAGQQSALYLFVIAVLVAMRMLVKHSRETSDSFLEYVKTQDTRQDERDDNAQQRADSCHAVQTAMIERFIEHSKESDSRRDAALEKSSQSITQAAQAISQCTQIIKRLEERGMGS